MHSFFFFSEGNKKEIQKNALHFPLSKESTKEFRMMDSFFLFLKKAKKELPIMQSLFFFPFPEENIKRDTNSFSLFSH